jgi:putative oxidoreductase
MNGQRLFDIGELAGRVLLGLLFVLEAFSKLGAYADAVRYSAAYGVPALLLPGAIALELGAGMMVIAGYHTRVAAPALSAFCLVVALIFHTKFSDLNQLVHFQKDFALAGAFLVLWAHGAGALSIDAWRARGPRPAVGLSSSATTSSP